MSNKNVRPLQPGKAKAKNSMKGGMTYVTQPISKPTTTKTGSSNKCKQKPTDISGGRRSNERVGGGKRPNKRSRGDGQDRSHGSGTKFDGKQIPIRAKGNEPKSKSIPQAGGINTPIWHKSLLCTNRPTTESVLVTTWIKLVQDIAPSIAELFTKIILSMDISEFIAKASRVAMNFISDTQPLVQDEDLYYPLSICDMRTRLQVTRFGKRYSVPISEISSHDQHAVVDAFLSRNKRNRLIDLSCYGDRSDNYSDFIPPYLANELRRISNSIFSCARIQPDLNRSYASDILAAPSGVTAEGLKLPFEKWCSISAAWNVFGSEFVNAAIHHHDLSDDLWYEPSVLRLVPKDHRGPRLIMEEPLERTLRQTRVAEFLHSVIVKPTFSTYAPDKAIVLDDQTQNQRMAYIGSIDSSLATIDLSNASDSITYKLVDACFPREVSSLILSGCSHRVRLPDDRVVRLNMPMTMGSRVTVPGQSLVYWMIVCVSYDYGRAHFDLDKYALQRCSVYNDDIIVPSEMYDIVCAMLEKCGLVVNHDKSYTGEIPFRESCGVDAWDGELVSSVYWPRREIQCDSKYLPSWISLHNKLYMLGAKGAATFIAQIVDALVPNVPRVLPGSQELGIYSYERLAETQPYKRFSWDVFVTIDIVDNYSMYINGVNGHTVAFLKFSRKDFRPGHTVCIQTYDDLIALLSGNIEYISLDPVSDRWYPFSVIRELAGRKIRSYDFEVIPEVYHAYDYQIANVYDNRISPNCFDSSVANNALIDYLWDSYSVSHFLQNGPEYYDETCKLLHVSAHRNLRKTQKQVSFKARRINYTVCDPTFIERGLAASEIKTKTDQTMSSADGDRRTKH